MDKVNQLFEQEVVKIVEAFPSIYTKDDVVSLLNTLRTQVLYETADALSKANAVSITEDQFQEFNSAVRSSLENGINNGSIQVYDESSAEFSIDYQNRVVLECVEINTDNITEELDDIMLIAFQQHFGDLLINNPE